MSLLYPQDVKITSKHFKKQINTKKKKLGCEIVRSLKSVLAKQELNIIKIIFHLNPIRKPEQNNQTRQFPNLFPDRTEHVPAE